MAISYGSVGFVGAGRVVSILLGGLARANAMPDKVLASAPDEIMVMEV